MKIHIFVRHCFYSPNVTAPNRTRPDWFDKTRCWNNLMRTAAHAIQTNVIFDTHFGNEKMCDYNYPGVTVTEINKGNEAESFLAMLDIVMGMNIPDDDIVYFLEDDYLHRENWHRILKEGFTTSADYVTLYDHADKYGYYPDLKSQILVTDSCHWRTTPSTTNTYAMKMGTLRADYSIHRHHSQHTELNITHDNSKFLELGQNGRKLISSIPGYSTHCDNLLSPTINWHKINNNE